MPTTSQESPALHDNGHLAAFAASSDHPLQHTCDNTHCASVPSSSHSTHINGLMQKRRNVLEFLFHQSIDMQQPYRPVITLHRIYKTHSEQHLHPSVVLLHNIYTTSVVVGHSAMFCAGSFFNIVHIIRWSVWTAFMVRRLHCTVVNLRDIQGKYVGALVTCLGHDKNITRHTAHTIVWCYLYTFRWPFKFSGYNS